MAMGIVSDSDFDSELKSLNKPREKPEPISPLSNPSNPPTNSSTIPSTSEPKRVEVLDAPHRGRSNGDNNVPESLRKLIGETANIEGRASALNLAKSFGISPSSVSAYTDSRTSTSSESKDEGIQKHILNAKNKISRKARAKLIIALNEITEEKIREAKLKDISSVAKDMAVVMKQMDPDPSDKAGVVNNGPTFVLFQPVQKSEDDYQTIHVRE